MVSTNNVNGSNPNPNPGPSPQPNSNSNSSSSSHPNGNATPFYPSREELERVFSEDSENITNEERGLLPPSRPYRNGSPSRDRSSPRMHYRHRPLNTPFPQRNGVYQPQPLNQFAPPPSNVPSAAHVPNPQQYGQAPPFGQAPPYNQAPPVFHDPAQGSSSNTPMMGYQGLPPGPPPFVPYVPHGLQQGAVPMQPTLSYDESNIPRTAGLEPANLVSGFLALQQATLEGHIQYMAQVYSQPQPHPEPQSLGPVLAYPPANGYSVPAHFHGPMDNAWINGPGPPAANAPPPVPVQALPHIPTQATASRRNPGGKGQRRQTGTTRNKTSPENVLILEAYYAFNPKPDGPAREELCKRTGMIQRQVQVWFQNRRSKTNLELARARIAAGLAANGQADGEAGPSGTDSCPSSAEVSPEKENQPLPAVGDQVPGPGTQQWPIDSSLAPAEVSPENENQPLPAVGDQVSGPGTQQWLIDPSVAPQQWQPDASANTQWQPDAGTNPQWQPDHGNQYAQQPAAYTALLESHATLPNFTSVAPPPPSQPPHSAPALGIGVGVGGGGPSLVPPVRMGRRVSIANGEAANIANIVQKQSHQLGAANAARRGSIPYPPPGQRGGYNGTSPMSPRGPGSAASALHVSTLRNNTRRASMPVNDGMMGMAMSMAPTATADGAVYMSGTSPAKPFTPPRTVSGAAGAVGPQDGRVTRELSPIMDSTGLGVSAAPVAVDDVFLPMTQPQQPPMIDTSVTNGYVLPSHPSTDSLYKSYVTPDMALLQNAQFNGSGNGPLPNPGYSFGVQTAPSTGGASYGQYTIDETFLAMQDRSRLGSIASINTFTSEINSEYSAGLGLGYDSMPTPGLMANEFDFSTRRASAPPELVEGMGQFGFGPTATGGVPMSTTSTTSTNQPVRPSPLGQQQHSVSSGNISAMYPGSFNPGSAAYGVGVGMDDGSCGPVQPDMQQQPFNTVVDHQQSYLVASARAAALAAHAQAQNGYNPHSVNHYLPTLSYSVGPHHAFPEEDEDEHEPEREVNGNGNGNGNGQGPVDSSTPDATAAALAAAAALYAEADMDELLGACFEGTASPVTDADFEALRSCMPTPAPASAHVQSSPMAIDTTPTAAGRSHPSNNSS